jgi:hypothetical protein
VLEGPAVSLWELLAQPRSESDVMKTLAKTYEVDVDVVAHDVGPLLVQLRDSGVVECRP